MYLGYLYDSEPRYRIRYGGWGTAETTEESSFDSRQRRGSFLSEISSPALGPLSLLFERYRTTNLRGGGG
jgi:hypothetical protein